MNANLPPGLPARGERNPTGLLSVKLTEEDWDTLMELKHAYEREAKTILTTTDVVRACIRAVGSAVKTYSAPAGAGEGGGQTTGLPGLNAVTPGESKPKRSAPRKPRRML